MDTVLINENDEEQLLKAAELMKLPLQKFSKQKADRRTTL